MSPDKTEALTKPTAKYNQANPETLPHKQNQWPKKRKKKAITQKNGKDKWSN